MGNKHGTLTLGRCRDKHRPDTRSRNWSFHSMDSRRAGSVNKSNGTSSVSIHTSGGQSFVQYQARGSSASRSAETKAVVSREDDFDGCSRAGLAVRSLSAPVHGVESDDSVPETDRHACASGPSKKPITLAGKHSSVHKIPLTANSDTQPVDIELSQQKRVGTNPALEDPWVRRAGRFPVSTDSTRSNIRKEAPCCKKLFNDMSIDSCRDNKAEHKHLGSSTKQTMKNVFAANRGRHKQTVKANREEKGLMNHKEGRDNNTCDISSHRVQAFSYLSKIWQEKLKSSSNCLRSKNHDRNMCLSQSGITKIKSTKEPQPAHTLSLEKTWADEPETYTSRERVLHFLTNQKDHKGLFANRKILNKSSVKNTRLYKSNETIINKSTDATVKEINNSFQTCIHGDVLPISRSEQILSTSDCVVPLLNKNKHRNLSSSSSDGLHYCENLGAKPPRYPDHRGLNPAVASYSTSNLLSEVNNASRIRQQLEVNSSPSDSQTQHDRDRSTRHRSRRSQQCFSLNLDTFTEEYSDQQDVHAKPASLLNLDINQITISTSSTRDKNIQRPTNSVSSRSNYLINSPQVTNTDKPREDIVPFGNKSTQGQVVTDMGKLNSSRCKLNLPVGRNRSSNRCDTKPFHFASSHIVDSSVSLVMPNLTTTPTTTDSGYNTESSFSCEKTPRIAKIWDSPISEMLYCRKDSCADYNTVDEEDLEETLSLTTSSSLDKLANGYKDEERKSNGANKDIVFENMNTPAEEKVNTDESARKTPELRLEESNMINNDPAIKTSLFQASGEPTAFGEQEWQTFSKQLNDWHVEFAKTCHTDYDLTATDTVRMKLRSGVSCEGFENKDGSDVDVCLRNSDSEEMKKVTIVEKNVHVTQSRITQVCDGQNSHSFTGGNDLINGKLMSLFGGLSYTEQKERALPTLEIANDRQEDRNLGKQEKNSGRLEETILIQEVTNYREAEILSTRHEETGLTRQENMTTTRQKEILSTRQDEMNSTVQVENSLSRQENTNRISCDMKSKESCHNKELSRSKRNSCLTDVFTAELLKLHQQENQCENHGNNESREGEHTDPSAGRSVVPTVIQLLICNTGCICDSSSVVAMANNERDNLGGCISSPTEVSQVNILNTRDGKTEVSSKEDIALVNENDNEMLPLMCVSIPSNGDSSMRDNVKDLSDNGCMIGLRTSHDYSTNAGENSPPNGTKLDIVALCSPLNSGRKGGNTVIEQPDHSTIDNSSHIVCRGRDGNSAGSYVCSGDGGVGDISGQTSRDTDQLKGLSTGSVSRCLVNGDNCSTFFPAACDEPPSQNVSLLSKQLHNNATCCDFQRDTDITTTHSITQAKILTILESSQGGHHYSQIDTTIFESTEDISKSTPVCDDEHISTNSLSCEFTEIVNSGYTSPHLKWRSSTPCFKEQSSSLCRENLVTCFLGSSDSASVDELHLGSNWTSSTIDRITNDFSSSDTSIDRLGQTSNSARFLEEPNQHSHFETNVPKVGQPSISDRYVKKLSPCTFSSSFTEEVSQASSSGKLVEKFSQPSIHEQFTERLSQRNNYNAYIEQLKLNQRESCDTSVDNFNQTNISNTTVVNVSHVVNSDAFTEKLSKRSERLHKALSFSDSNLPNSLFNESLKSAVQNEAPKARRKLAFGFTEVDVNIARPLIAGDFSYPLNEVKLNNICRSQNQVVSGCSRYVSDNRKIHGLYTCGSAEMLNSCYHYSDNGEYNVGDNCVKKVASCTNLAEQGSKYRSRIAMGMASARMRLYASPPRSNCMGPSLRSTLSASPISKRTPPEISITSKSMFYLNPRQTHVMENSYNWKTAINPEGLQNIFPTPNTHFKHSRSLDMHIDRRGCTVYTCEHAQSRCTFQMGDRQAGRFLFPGQSQSADGGQRCLCEPEDVSTACFGRYQLEQLPCKSRGNDFQALSSSSCKITTISAADVIYTPSSCFDQTNLNSGNPDKDLQIVYTKDSIKSGSCHPYRMAPNYTFSSYNQIYKTETPLHGQHFTKLRNRCINSLNNVLGPDYSHKSYSGDSPAKIDPLFNNPPAELDNRSASGIDDITNTKDPNLYLHQISPLTIDSNPAVMSSRDKTSPGLGELASGLRHNHTERVWSYSMTSLLEGNTSADVLCVEDASVMDAPAVEVCPSCHRPFDSGKKRRLIDSCGHERCYSCMFSSEICSICVATASIQMNVPGQTVPPADYRPRVKLNHRLTDDTGRKSDPPEIPPRVRIPAAHTGVLGPPPRPAKGKYIQQDLHHHWDNHRTVQYSNQSTSDSNQVGCKSSVTMETLDLDRESDSPPPPPPDVAQHDLMMRLGLLLGDPIHPSGITGVGVVLSGSQLEETTLNSISSLSSNEHTPEKCASDASPMSTLTVSSGGEFSMPPAGPHIHPTYSFLVGNQDVHNTSPNSDLIFQRPHSITTSIPGAIEDLPLFGSKRNTSVRRSARVSVNGRRSESRTTKSDVLQLKPLTFEIPHPEGKPIFVGRAWLFNKLEAVFGADGCGVPKSNGIIITGSQGTGKTAIVEQLVNHSCFSDDSTGCKSARPQDQNQVGQGHSTKLTDYTALNGLGFQVIAYHICQADNSATCMVADMVSSMAAQMAKAPQLVAYRELLLQEPYLQTILSISECTQNPSLSFLKGILEPLRMLKNAGKIFTDCCIILVDSLNEAEFHKPDHGDTIASFLCRHASKFPDWLKLVVTVQSSLQEITSSLPFSRISLDQHGNNSDNVSRDIVSYIDHRISVSSTIRANIAVNGRPNKELTAKFTSHVQNLSNGSFLYAKLVLDLIENGHLVPKSSNYTILPVNLSEVFLLHFNLKFSSIRAFERVSAILSVCLASLYPLTLVDIFLTVNSGYIHQYLSWEDFSLRMDVLAGFIYCCHDKTIMFFHPAFREWLIHRDEGDSPKFICDLRHGHALMAFRLSRVSAPLTPDKTIEFGHHILKAHIYKTVSRQLGYSSQNVQAYWMCLSSHSLNAALVSHRNVYSPNVKVSQLILLSGGNSNSRTEYLSNAPVLCVAAKEGYIDMLSLLLEFGADPNATSDTGMTPLCHGAAGGHVEVMRMLCLHNARPSAQDEQGHSAAIHAVIHGQLEAVKFLMHLNWTVQPNEPTKDEVVTQCFVASAATGNMQILEYLHDTYNGSRLNMVDSLLSETALTAACLHGRALCVKFLLDSGADVTVSNARFYTPLLCAVKCGRWEVCDLLLTSGADLEMTDQYGRTPLMTAAGDGHITVLNLLLDKGASQDSTDRQGLTALCWACLQGHLSVVESLVRHGSNVNHSDIHGRSPLHLAAMYGDINVVQFLSDHKAQIEHTDLNGMRALDCAIDYNNMAIIICFLRKGAKLGPNTWTLAAEKTDILLLLLNKLTEDGSILYKKNRIKEASQRYQYALKKLPMDVKPEEVQTFQELKLSFLLNLSRCKRRMNDLQSAVDLATKALEVRPNCFEAFYARARARRDNRQYAAAQQDLLEALHLAPKNRELQRLLTRVKEECWEQMARYESGGGREKVTLEMDRIAEDDTDSLTVDNPGLYLPTV